MKSPSSENLPEAISQIIHSCQGEISFSAKNLTTGARLDFHPRRNVSTASVIKLPVLVHVLMMASEGKISLDQPLTLTANDKVPGSGVLYFFDPGLTLSVRDACNLMIAVSDNTATNLILDQVGLEAVNQRMRSLGLKVTEIFARVFRPNPNPTPRNRRYGLGVTTPAEMVDLLERLATHRIADDETSRLAMEFLDHQHYRDGIPRRLPNGYKFAGKSGAVDHLRSDVGVVTTPSGEMIAMAIFATKMRSILWSPDNPGLIVIAELAAAMTRHLEKGRIRRSPSKGS